MNSPSLSRWILQAGGGLLIWVAQFLACYVLAAVACARALSTVRLAGFSAVTVVTLLVSLLAAAGCAALLLHARRSPGCGSDDPAEFLSRVTQAVAGLALIAVIWTGIAAAMPLQCPE